MLLITRKPGQGIVVGGILQVGVRELRGDLACCELQPERGVRLRHLSLGYLAAGGLVPALSPAPCAPADGPFTFQGPANAVLTLVLSQAATSAPAVVMHLAVLNVSTSKVKLGIDRPEGYVVLRAETYQQLRASNAQAAARPADVDAVAAAVRREFAGGVPARAKGVLTGADTPTR